MSPEDFMYGPRANHPEVASNLEAMMPAKQETLSGIMDEIVDKTKNGVETSGEKWISLYYHGESRPVATLMKCQKGLHCDNPNYIGQVHTSSAIEGSNERLITNYFIIDAPDSLQIEKHVQESMNRFIIRGEETIDQMKAKSSGLLKALLGQMEAQKTDNELGLTFVSEYEARELLAQISNPELTTKPPF